MENVFFSENMKYPVRKKIVIGQKFLEDQYPPYPEDLVGKWVKYGHSYNSVMNHLLCESCRNSFAKYERKLADIQMQRSYQERRVGGSF